MHTQMKKAGEVKFSLILIKQQYKKGELTLNSFNSLI